MTRKKHRNRKHSGRTQNTKRLVSVLPGRSPFRVQMDKLPVGYAMNDCEPGDTAHVVYREFRSSEDGDLFVTRLEGIPGMIINLVRSKYKLPLFEGSIGCMVAIIKKDRSAEVYINPPCKAFMQIKTPRAILAGEHIYTNEVSDVQKVAFEGVDFPNDTGVITLFSVGWRRGLFFDFGPLRPNGENREYDVGLLLRGYYSYLFFRNLFELSEDHWQALFDQQWFPFISLSSGMIGKIIEFTKKGKDIDKLLPDIKAELDSMLPGQMTRWRETAAFKPHMTFLAEAFDQYQNGTHVSCLSVLFPRIEGILRTFQQLMGCATKSGQRDLAGIVVSDSVNPKHPLYSPLLPARFNKYLEECFFANFDPTSTNHRLSRNSVGHGVADEHTFNLKGSLIGFLILCQLGLYFAGVEGKGAGA